MNGENVRLNAVRIAASKCDFGFTEAFARGILLESQPDPVTAASVSVHNVTPAGFVSNLIAATLGNIVGGTLLLARIYRFEYLRRHRVGPREMVARFQQR